jgi:hypothetical protein
MAVARHRALGDALVFDCGLEHHAIGELIDRVALDPLPRGLALRELVAALLVQLRAPPREFYPGNQHFGRSLVEIDAHSVTDLEQRQSSAYRRFWRGIDNRGRGRGARLASEACFNGMSARFTTESTLSEKLRPILTGRIDKPCPQNIANAARQYAVSASGHASSVTAAS